MQCQTADQRRQAEQAWHTHHSSEQKRACAQPAHSRSRTPPPRARPQCAQAAPGSPPRPHAAAAAPPGCPSPAIQPSELAPGAIREWPCRHTLQTLQPLANCCTAPSRASPQITSVSPQSLRSQPRHPAAAQLLPCCSGRACRLHTVHSTGRVPRSHVLVSGACCVFIRDCTRGTCKAVQHFRASPVFVRARRSRNNRGAWGVAFDGCVKKQGGQRQQRRLRRVTNKRCP